MKQQVGPRFGEVYRMLTRALGIERLALVAASQPTQKDSRPVFEYYGRLEPETLGELRRQAQEAPPRMPDEGLFVRRRHPKEVVLEAEDHFEIDGPFSVAANLFEPRFVQLIADHQPGLAEERIWRERFDEALGAFADIRWRRDPVERNDRAVAASLDELWRSWGMTKSSSLLAHIKAIARRTEEGKKPRGLLLVVPRRTIERLEDSNRPWSFAADDRPRMDAPKHVVKVLLASGTGATDWRRPSSIKTLLCDGRSLYGLYSGPRPAGPSLLIAFRSRKTYLSLYYRRLGEFARPFIYEAVDGEWLPVVPSYTRRVLLELMPSLLRRTLHQDDKALVEAIIEVQEHAQKSRHGCVVALVDSSHPRARPWRSGHRLAPALPLIDESDARLHRQNIETAAELASMDGALHIDENARLLAFGCLMDGDSHGVEEHPERGARFNSSKRFTHHRENTLVVSVSEDGPATVFFNGQVELNEATFGDWAPKLTAEELSKKIL